MCAPKCKYIHCIVKMDIEMAQETSRLGSSAGCFVGKDIWNKNVAAYAGLKFRTHQKVWALGCKGEKEHYKIRQLCCSSWLRLSLDKHVWRCS